MSYILEALKKSDQERQRGTAPNLQTPDLSGQTAHKSRLVWPYLLIAALLTNAGLLLWWLQPWGTNKVETAREQSSIIQPHGDSLLPPNPPDARSRAGGKSPETSKTFRSEARNSEKLSIEAKEPAPTKPDSSPSHALLADSSEKSAKTGKSTKAMSDSLVSSDASDAKTPQESRSPAMQKQDSVPNRPKISRERDAPQEQSGKASRFSAVHERASNASPAPLVSTAPPDRSDASKKADTQQKTEGKTEATVEAEIFSEMVSLGTAEIPTPKQKTDALSLPHPDAPSGRKAMRFNDLPASVRQGIPKMNFSVLIYSDNPADRMININGRTTREGQEVSDGLKLEEITQDGAIFSFKGYRFQRGVF